MGVTLLGALNFCRGGSQFGEFGGAQILGSQNLFWGWSSLGGFKLFRVVKCLG